MISNAPRDNVVAFLREPYISVWHQLDCLDLYMVPALISLPLPHKNSKF